VHIPHGERAQTVLSVRTQSFRQRTKITHPSTHEHYYSHCCDLNPVLSKPVSSQRVCPRACQLRWAGTRRQQGDGRASSLPPGVSCGYSSPRCFDEGSKYGLCYLVWPFCVLAVLLGDSVRRGAQAGPQRIAVELPRTRGTVSARNSGFYGNDKKLTRQRELD